MERKMMEGIKDRAEGRVEPPYIQPLEIGLWLLAFAAGVAAAVLYMRGGRWWEPLIVGIASVPALLWFTFIQPAIWLRVLIDIVLIGGVYLSWRRIVQQKEGT
jgi:uncharacterized membrane protein YjjP (DUF1212 family)